MYDLPPDLLAELVRQRQREIRDSVSPLRRTEPIRSPGAVASLGRTLARHLLRRASIVRFIGADTGRMPRAPVK